MNIIASILITAVAFMGGLFATPKTNPNYDGANVSNEVRLGATSYPTALDTLTNPGATDSVATVSHSSQHANANDAIEALEAKLGTGASTASSNTVLSGTGSGASSWSGTPTLSTITTTGLGTFANLLSNGSSTLQAFTFTNATGTNATTTSFFSTTASTTNLYLATGACTGANALNVSGGKVTCGAVSTSGSTAVTLVPPANYVWGTATNNITGRQIAVNTTAHLGQIVVNSSIIVNKVSVNISTHAANGTLKIAIFSENGQTQHITFETATITTTGVVTTTLGAPVTLSAGVYYAVALPTGTTDVTLSVFGSPAGAMGNLNGSVSGEPIINGTYTVTAGTMPATITLASIVDGTTAGHTAILRLDN